MLTSARRAASMAAVRPGSVVPSLVGGATFRTVAAFEKAIGPNGTAVLAPGQSFKINVGKPGMGVTLARVMDLNQGSAFTSEWKGGHVVVTAKETARPGRIDAVTLQHGGPVIRPGVGRPPVKFPFTLEVGLAPRR